MMFLDKHGFPVERRWGRWFQNFLRLLIHTRKIRFGLGTWYGVPFDKSVAGAYEKVT